MNSHVTASLVKDDTTAYHKPCIMIFHTLRKSPFQSKILDQVHVTSYL